MMNNVWNWFLPADEEVLKSWRSKSRAMATTINICRLQTLIVLSSFLIGGYLPSSVQSVPGRYFVLIGHEEWKDYQAWFRWTSECSFVCCQSSVLFFRQQVLNGGDDFLSSSSWALGGLQKFNQQFKCFNGTASFFVLSWKCPFLWPKTW